MFSSLSTTLVPWYVAGVTVMTNTYFNDHHLRRVSDVGIFLFEGSFGPLLRSSDWIVPLDVSETILLSDRVGCSTARAAIVLGLARRKHG